MPKSTLLPMDDEALRQYLKDRKQALLLSFWAPWCGTSTALDPLLQEIAHDYQKRLTVSRMNVDENAHAPAEYGVRSIPHLILFQDGTEVASVCGSQPKSKIVEFLETHLSS